MSCGAADVINRGEESQSWEQRERDAAWWLSGNRPERAKLTAMVCGNVWGIPLPSVHSPLFVCVYFKQQQHELWITLQKTKYPQVYLHTYIWDVCECECLSVSNGKVHNITGTVLLTFNPWEFKLGVNHLWCIWGTMRSQDHTMWKQCVESVGFKIMDYRRLTL